VSAGQDRPLDRVGRLADTIEFSAVDGPGNRFVVFLQGCNLDCLACHNPQTIPLGGGRPVTVGGLVEQIRHAAPFLSGVTVSGGEATLQAAFVHDLFDALGADPALTNLTRFLDTNGDADRATWDALDGVLDGAMVDLKALDAATHVRLTGHGNDRVLDSIRLLHARGKLYEVRLLLAVGANDSDEALLATGAWLADVDPAMRVKVIGYRAHGVRKAAASLVEPTAGQRQRYAEVLSRVADFDVTAL
jgi:pyruvate formate lyase activating enzyme